MLDACIQNFFRVSTLYRVGGERTSRKFRKGCTVLRGNREMTEKYEYCSTVPRNFVQDWFGVWLSQKFVWMSLDPSAFNLYFHKYLKNVSVILISDWILSKRFYIKSTDVSICPLRNLYWDTFVPKKENSFKEGTIYVLGHTLQYFGWVYKQAILSDNWDEKEFWISFLWRHHFGTL